MSELNTRASDFTSRLFLYGNVLQHADVFRAMRHAPPEELRTVFRAMREAELNSTDERDHYQAYENFVLDRLLETDLQDRGFDVEEIARQNTEIMFQKLDLLIWLTVYAEQPAFRERHVKFIGIDALRQALAREKGAVLTFYHWGLFQAFFFLIAAELGHPASMIAADEPLEYQRKVIDRFIPSVSANTFMLPLAPDIIRTGVERLKQNQLLCLLPELSGVAGRRPKTKLEFLGTQVYAPEGAAAFASFSGAPLFVGRIEQTGPSEVTVIIDELAASVKRGQEGIQKETRHLWNHLEQCVLRQPEQWGGWEIFDRIFGPLKEGNLVHLLLHNRAFALIWLGKTTSRLGDSFYNIAGMWLLWELTHSAKILGLAGTLMLLTSLVGFVAGNYVDRWDRRQTMIVTDLIRGVIVLLVPVCFAFGFIHWALVIGVLVAIEVVNKFFTPAYRAMIPDLVSLEQLTAVTGFLFVTEQIALVAGALLAGSLLGFMGADGAFAFNAATFYISAVCILLMPPTTTLASTSPPDEPTDKKSNLSSVKEILHFIKSTPFLAITTPLMTFLYFSFAPVFLLLSKWSDDVLGKGVFGYSVLEIAFSVGMLLGGLLSSRLTKNMSPYRTLLLGLGGAAAAIGMFAITHYLLIAAILLALMGMCISVANVMITTVQQQIVPSHFRGRYFSISQTLITIALPLGYAISGISADAFGITPVFFGVAIGFALGTLLLIGNRSALQQNK